MWLVKNGADGQFPVTINITHPFHKISPSHSHHCHRHIHPYIYTVSLVNNLGETPYDLAIQHRHQDCSDFIARSMRLAYSFWRIPTWNQYLHRMDYSVPRGLEEYHPWGPKDHPWGRNNHPWGPGSHPWGPERHLWGTKVPYEAVPKYCYQHRSPCDHYKCPDDILWTELETEEQRRYQRPYATET